MHRIVCPYCFEKFFSSQIAFRCLNPDSTRCQPVEDKAMAEYQRLSIPQKLPRVFVPEKKWWRTLHSATCVCGAKTIKSVCPHCHNDLPSGFRSKDSYTIALIGAKEAGKSNFIAVLIHELNNRVGDSFDASLESFDEQTRIRYKQDFRKYVYENREVVPATLSARALVNVRYPLIYIFSLRRRGLSLNKKRKPSSLVFFDTAGEDLTNIDIMSTEARYLANSDALIFLLDPLQIPAVRNLVGNSMPLPSENTEPQEIIGRVAQLIRQSRGMKQSDVIKSPVALAFSKIDTLRYLFDLGSPVHRASNHQGFFDVTETQQISDSIRAYLSEWIGSGLDRFVQHNFESFSYFGVSALGSPPDQEGRLPMGAAPFRVEDPFLWILYKLKIISRHRSKR